ncbi:MAG: HAD-IIIC family phosphatase [Candidatus Electrothrix gigas]
MKTDLYADLAWLPQRPDNFIKKCRKVLQDPDGLGLRIRGLASYSLDDNDLHNLAKLIAKATEKKYSLEPLIPFKLGIVSNATTHFLVPALVATAARYGIALECIEADFGQTMQAAMDASSSIHQAQPDAVLIAIDYRGLPLQLTPGDQVAHDATVAACLQYIDNIRNGLHAHNAGFCIVQTIVRPVESLTGSFELVLPGTTRSLLDAINTGLAQSVHNSPDVLVDIAGLAETVGLGAWHDPVYWYMAKLPFSNRYLPLYADHLCRCIVAARGKSRRCLILDLDNTVWGGIIGDDGLEGIVIGQGDPVGEAHFDVQQTALALRERGIVLAVSSKNYEEIARIPFQQHPDMLLKEDHIAVFQANWDDKASNISVIANTLSLGLDSMVLLDDNPAERDLVRQMLPQVAVPELPDNPALYTRYLLAGGYFESIVFSAEDRKRAQFYQENAKRVALQEKVGDLDTYLESLEMEITFQPFNDTGCSRVTQLINRSNQYNLTTRRYTEEEVKAFQDLSDGLTLQVRLTDIFGDNGIICVVICRPIDQDWEIDTWLISCRVLGRKVEHAVLQEIVFQARKQGIRRLIGIYRPSGRNKLVADHYEKLGFTAYGCEEDGVSSWQLEVASALVDPVPMKVSRVNFDSFEKS